ncbi:hypothetical protein EG347_03695 [Chryseobacterium sp. G0186]|uniref:polymer-forming cytoskeletal protein n=1 Tax=Chryseobacterium sp. G0186 TaxID=2487064 RepID=UPI000F4F1AF1|nr:polymer-forming cytoskeletal protein [Chryseobacterium sp. G0186]AZA76684.1 hypothetical protein EG347_03695 [Chryseobacterium sp. G0186]
MKELQQLTKDQLYNRLSGQSESFYSTVYSALENTLFSDQSLDEEDLSEFLEMLDKETAEKIKEAALHTHDEDDTPKIILSENKNTDFLNVITEDGEGYTIILIEGDIELSGNLFIEDYVVLVILGNIKAENIIVNGSLYCSGSLSCNVLFGASSNDHETYVDGNISSLLVAENGQYTVAKGSIYADYLMSFHNEIEGKSGRFIQKISCETDHEAIILNPKILDKNGYFDEHSFLNFIDKNPVDALFK